MKSDNLLYQKRQGSVPMRTPLPSKQKDRNNYGNVSIPKISNHTKEVGTLSPAIVYVISGGEDREKKFIRNIKNDKILGSCIQVLFESKKGQGLVPKQMNEVWQNARTHKRIKVDGIEYRLRKIDRVFLVSDVDEFESQLVTILSNKEKDDIGQWIISNPCIELWLYYCFKRDITPEIQKLRYVKRSHRSQLMKKLNDTLIVGGADPRKAFDNTPTGIDNSKLHYRSGHYRIPRLFATSFHFMMEQILSFVTDRGHSFKEYQEAKRRKIEAYLANN